MTRVPHHVLLVVLQPGDALLLRFCQPFQLGRVAGGEGDQRVDMHPDDVTGIDPANERSHERTDIAALHTVTVVAEARHQLGERRRDAGISPAGLGEWYGEPKPGQRRHHDMERVGRIPAVGGRVGERPDEVDELGERSGPAVDEQQRHGVRFRRFHVQEVDGLAVDLGGELRQTH